MFLDLSTVVAPFYCLARCHLTKIPSSCPLPIFVVHALGSFDHLQVLDSESEVSSDINLCIIPPRWVSVIVSMCFYFV